MKFAEVFQKCRQATGLSLREFCRRNKYDAANISRLERGLLKPPQSTDVLLSYAKSLGLKPDSAQCQSLIELAALENGMVSPRIQESQVMRENLPKVFQRLREEVKHKASWTTALDLEGWADSYTAPSLLPKLLRLLVRNSPGQLTRVEFPAYEGVRRPGWDGIVEAAEGNEFVPIGVSVWELGTDKKIAAKATDDFKKRTKKPPLGFDTRQLVYIVATPRKWIGKNAWCEKQKKLGKWKDVRVYDSSVLEEWLEVSTRTDIWFSTIIGHRPQGITGIAEHWVSLSALANPALLPDVFLVSREEDIKAISEWIQGLPRILSLEAHSPNEVIDFIAAYIASRPQEERDPIESRVLIVDDIEAWKLLCSSSSKFILIPKPSFNIESEMISAAIRQGHHVLLCASAFTNDNSSRKLSRVYHYDLEKALVKSGFKEIQAAQLAREAGGSLTILKRRLPGAGRMNRPPWSNSSDAEKLSPILLVGQWDDSSEADRRILAALSGTSYEEVLSIANRYVATTDPLIIRLQSAWTLISRDDSWELLSSNLLAKHLDIFEKVAHEILSEVDPRYDLPIGERWYASIKNKVPKFSGRLKKGVAQTLVLMAVNGGNRVISTPVTPAYRVERVIRKVLSGADWKIWASLNHVLPLMAEAAPGVFLDIIEKDIYSAKPQLPSLMVDDGDALTSSCMHSGLLWGLETLAWNPDLLSRTALVLARLSELDPGGKWSNRPHNSLVEIFLPWFPQTAASVEQRIEVLKKLVNDQPKTGCKLLLHLLPSAHSSSFHTSRPAWREWALGWQAGVTNQEYWKQAGWCAEKLVELLDSKSSTLWSEVIDKIEDLPKKAYDELIAKMRRLPGNGLPQQIRQVIFDALREKINRHRSCAGAEWAMQEESLVALEEIKEMFVPDDPIQKNKWLFASYPEIPERNFEAREEKIFELRLNVLKELLKQGGISKLLEFSQAIEAPYAMGIVLGKAGLIPAGLLVPNKLSSKESKIVDFATGYIVGCFSVKGWEWLDQFSLKKWSPEQLSPMLLVLPFERKTWRLAESLGRTPRANYWSRINSCYLWNADSHDAKFAVKRLLEFNRPLRAIDLLSNVSHKTKELDATLIMDVLDALSKLPKDSAKEQMNNNTAYHIQELFRILQADKTVDQSRLAVLEWQYLTLLQDHHGGAPKALLKRVQLEPAFFVEVLSMAFRSKLEGKKRKALPSAQQRAVATNAYKLLTSIKSIPSVAEDGSVDKSSLDEWISKVRLLAKKAGRIEVCDSRIGEMFAYAPAEKDKSWPCETVRDIIEDLKSEELERGLYIGLRNKRGVVSKSLNEGGRQEHVLADKYNGYAKQCCGQWPRTASVLREVAESYKLEAKREDEKAQTKID